MEKKRRKFLPVSTGDVFARLTVSELDRVDQNKYGSNLYYFKCICVCGNTCSILQQNLTQGRTRSCGCLGWENCKTVNLKNGLYVEGCNAMLNRYKAMISRCFNPKNSGYKDYGGRGIGVCERWQKRKGSNEGFYNFLADMGECEEGMTLERKDVNGDYSPENCTWAGRSVQGYNKRRNYTNTSGRTGVYRTENGTAWWAEITKDKVRHYLGRFKTFEEAVVAREAAELQYFGELKPEARKETQMNANS